MTLRRKTIYFIIVTFIVLIGAMYLISQQVLLNSFARVEEQNTVQNVERALNALFRTISSLEVTTAELATRDETYAFIEEANIDYIKAHASNAAFAELKLNFMLLVNASGQVVFAKAYDAANKRETSVPQSLMAHVSANRPLVRHPDTASSVTGVLLLPEGPVLIASKPILTSQGQGPIRGALVMGRYLDASEVNRLVEMTLLSLATYRFDDARMPADFKTARFYLSRETPILVQPLSEKSIAGYALLEDIYGKPGLVLRVDMPRDIFEQGQISIAYLVLMTVVLALALGAVIIFLLEKQVLSRLSHLIHGVSGIGTSGDLSTRVSVSGKDEMTSLAHTINEMLAALQKSESELRESEKRYRLLGENVSDVIWTTDMNNRLTYVSPSVTQLLGYSVEEALTRPIEKVFTAASVEMAMKTFTEELEKLGHDSQFEPWTLELEMIRKDGSIVPVEVGSSWLRESGGQPIGVLAIARDITERKQAQQTLERLYKEEKKLRQKLETEIKKRVEFTRALVHELKTPITPVLASSELLLEELKDSPLLGLAQNIKRGAGNLNQRIDELLDLARGELGMLRLNPSPLDPMRLLNEIAGEMTPVAWNNKQSLRLELPVSLPLAWADEDRLRQVILNLLNNALKFTPQRGKIILRAKADDDSLVVEVQDTGRGISKEDQKRLFEPYQPLERDKAHLSGLGLGLALSKRLVELHGGQIWVKSRKGKGSTFGFAVPLGEINQEKGE